MLLLYVQHKYYTNNKCLLSNIHYRALLNYAKVCGASIASASRRRTCVTLLLLKTAGNYKSGNFSWAPLKQNSYNSSRKSVTWFRILNERYKNINRQYISPENCFLSCRRKIMLKLWRIM